ncbi:MAG: cytochrome oxidase small assembly protein [Burkholderiales bacterium]
MSRNARTGLIIATVALAFFFGIIARYWLIGR